MPARAPHERRHRTMVIDARAAGVGQGLLFHSNWSTATGTGDDALRDTDKDEPWTGDKANGSTTVVTVASLSLTSPGFTNCLLIDSDSNAVEGVHWTMTPVALNETRNIRLYCALLWPEGTASNDGSWHPADQKDGGASGTLMCNLFHIRFNLNGGWTTGYFLEGSGTKDVDLSTGSAEIELDRQEFWGLEVQMSRTAANVMEVTNAWVYDDQGNEVYGPEDHYHNVNGDNLTESAMVWDSPDGDWDTTDWQALGSNGSPPEVPTGENMWAYGGFAVYDNVSQIGPYSGGI